MEFGMHRAKRLILWMGCLVTIGCIWVICCYQIRHDREQARLVAETTASNFAKAFEEHVRGTLTQIDSTLLTMRDDYIQHPQYFTQQLAIYKKNLYHNLIIQVSVIDANGIMTFNEQYMPKVPLNLSDREHFQVHRNSSRDVLFISKPLLGRVSKRWSIQFTRKILRHDGSFGGVMVISVDPAFFTSFFRSFDLGKKDVVSLVGMDRVIRARSASSNQIESLPADRPFFDRNKPDAGIFHVTSVLDGVDRTYAYRRFSNYPLALSVGLADEGVYGPVDSRRNILILLASFLSALLLVGTKVIFCFDKQQGRIEQSLREAKQRLELATASGHLGVWQWDIQSGEIAWDARMRELYGVVPGSFSGRLADFEHAVHPDDLPGVREALETAMRGEGEFAGEFRVVRPDGTVRILKADGLVIRDGAGRALRMIGLNTDITEQKQMEKALHDSEQQFRTLCDAAPIGIFRSDREGKTIYCNPRWEKITGIAACEAMGEPWTKWSHPDDLEEAGKAWQEAVTEAKIFSHEHRQVTREGKVSWIRALANPLVGPDGALLSHVGTLEDITDLQQARQDMLKTQKLQSLGVLAGGIAHDFNNILTVIFANVSIARMQMNDPAKMAQRLAEAENAITRATDLTKQLLTFSRGGTPIKKIIPVNELLREAACFVLHGSAANCSFELADDIWTVEADEGQVAQVVHNLILNAVQAMPNGGTVTIRSENAGSAAAGGRFVNVSVLDTGVGIPEKILHEIFDPYFTTKPQGNGLGLATCYSIVKKHGGSITVVSSEGEGSTFTVSLPAAEQGAVSARSPRNQLVQGSGRVLVMDDDAAIRDAAQTILEELGYAVEVAENGAIAVELYLKRKSEGKPFCVVILDMTVPGGMGGKETIEKLLRLDPQVNAIVSSGYSNDTVMANYRAHGFRAVLSKPYLPQQISQVLSELTRPAA